MKTLHSLAALLTFTTAIHAEPAQVVTDIAPVHSLVAMVSKGVAEPAQILPAGASAHDFALQPSQARQIVNADLVVWIGDALSPALGRSLDALAPDVPRLTLADAPGTQRLPYRELEDYAEAEHEHEEEHDAEATDAHAHEDKDAHGHDDHADDKGDDHGHAHDHGDLDPHLWLSPANAQVWLTAIAEALGANDPENAALYRANAEAAAQDIAALTDALRQKLAPLQGQPLLVSHDAFQYFEAAFGLRVIGAVSDSHAASPGPARLAALQERVRAEKPVCLLVQAGENSRLIDTVSEGSAIPTAALDPAGSTLLAGAALYPALLSAMADALLDCVTR